MASRFDPPRSGATTRASDATVAPSSEGLFAREDDVGDAPEAIDSAGLEFELDAIAGARRYEPGALLGSGGMGDVRLTLDSRIGRRVAKKTMHEHDNATRLRRFLREVRVQGQLEHPAIVPVYDLDVDDEEQVYFTMKRVRGETLERVLELLREGDPAWRRRFGTKRLLAAFVQVCHAVDYAHGRRVIHRDLKPANVMLGSHGEVYLLDWGLAKVGDAVPAPSDDRASHEDDADEAAPVPPSTHVVGASSTLTAGDTILGTIAYMAPEQLAGGAGRADARSDVYALGAILFEILTLTRFRAETSARDLRTRIAAAAAPRASDRVASVPPELDELCARALSARSEDRPESARALAEAVERYLDGEQDAELRKELAAKHAASAKRRVDAAHRSAEGRVEAMREAMKALALDAEQPDAQQLLLDLLTHAPDDVPKAASPELDEAADRSRKIGLRIAAGMVTWLGLVPLVMIAGVKSWTIVGAASVLTAAGALLARHLARKTPVRTSGILMVVGIVAIIIALTSAYLGPFTIAPTVATASAMALAMSAAPRERWMGGLLFVAGALLPFVVEGAGLGPPAYAFEPNRMIVFARAVELGRWSTMVSIAYSTVGFILLPIIVIGRLRDALLASERRESLQAWYLRQLFSPRSAARTA
jgi:serine/threonine-protein kinase